MNPIPAELRQLNQWVCWRYEGDGPKPTKVPYSPAGGKASTTNPARWGSYQAAVGTASKERLSGIGFVFTPSDPYVGIDLDGCLDDDGQVADWATEIVADLDTYTEITPSGRGLHLICRATLTQSVKTAKIEIYSVGRYFTMTGKPLPGTPATVNERPAALARLLETVARTATEAAPAKRPASPAVDIDDAYLRWWGERVIESAVARMAAAGDGERHATRVDMGRLLGGLIPHGLMTEARAERLLFDALRPQANADQERAAIRDGIAYGQAAPLPLPEPPPQPTFDDGVACCPVHQRPLSRGRRMGWYCASPADTASGWCDFWWIGDGYQPTATTEYDPPATSNGTSNGHVNLATGEIISLPSAMPAAQRPWPRLRADAEYGLAGEVLATIMPQTEADPAAILAGFLVSFGNVAGRGAHAIADGARHGLNEFALIVGDSAKARKDTARHQIRRLMEAVVPDWSRERQASGLSSGEGFIYAIRDRQTKTERNTKTGTYEEAETDRGIADKRLLVDESEFAGVLKQTGREGNTLSVQIRTAWDGRDLRNMTKNNPLRASSPHVSIIANITREELKRLLSEIEAANGFANRFLIILVKRSQLLPNGGDLPIYGDLPLRIRDAVEWASQEHTYQRDRAANDLWRAVYTMIAEQEHSGLVGTLLARAEAHLLRLSCLYAALDLTAMVREEHLRAAIALWRYCEESVAYIFADSTGHPLADRILASLLTAPEGLSRTDIQRLCGNNATVAMLDNALGTLQRTRRAFPHRDTTTRGRPSEIWSARASDSLPDPWGAVLQ